MSILSHHFFAVWVIAADNICQNERWRELYVFADRVLLFNAVREIGYAERSDLMPVF